MTSKDIEFKSKETDLTQKLSKAQSNIEKLENNKIEIKDIKIPEVQRKSDFLKEMNNSLKIEFIRPKFKHFEFWPTLFFLLTVFTYLFIFYSSAAYILIFAKKDAELSALRGEMISPPEIFNPDALQNAMEKGTTAILFLILFVVIPLGISVLDKFLNLNKISSIILTLFLFVLVDGAIAYQVAESIHAINYKTGKTDEIWHFSMVFHDVNFYLVFILGTLGLIIFKLCYKKLISFFEERNPDLNGQKNKALIMQNIEKIEENNCLIAELKQQSLGYENDIILLNNEISNLSSELTKLPILKGNNLEKINIEHNIRVQEIEKTTDIYLAHIENDNVPISMDSINDRINIYLEGWNKYLHEHYSITKASEMSSRANDEAIIWKNKKTEQKALDSRLVK